MFAVGLSGQQHQATKWKSCKYGCAFILIYGVMATLHSCIVCKFVCNHTTDHMCPIINMRHVLDPHHPQVVRQVPNATKAERGEA